MDKYRVLDDSFFATATTSDKSRYVFFQNDTGKLLYIKHSPATNEWLVSNDLLIPFTEDARSHTPLAACTLGSVGNELVRLMTVLDIVLTSIGILALCFLPQLDNVNQL